MIIKRRFVILGALVALLLVASMASASPAAPGTPTLRWRATANPNVAEIRADGITDGSTAWSLVDSSVSLHIWHRYFSGYAWRRWSGHQWVLHQWFLHDWHSH